MNDSASLLPDRPISNRFRLASGYRIRSLDLNFAILAGVSLLSGVVLSYVDSIPVWISLACYWCAYCFGGYFATVEAIHDLQRGRFQIDFLMVVAAVGAAFLGRLGEGALLLFLFSMGNALEHFAMGRARRAIESLAELAPTTAHLRIDGELHEVPVSELQVGHRIVIKPNERVPMDGFVVRGESGVNQAPITGESIPVDKWPVADIQVAYNRPESVDSHCQVFAGSINQSGALEIQVTRLAADSTLARVVKMVNEASSQKSPSQHFAERFEKYFVPTVLVFVVLLLFARLVVEEPFAASFSRAMAVLIGASPCALAISTPSAVLSGVARGAQVGVLIKGGNPLENLGRLTSIAFDKTGTLTEGNPRLTDVIRFGEASDVELLQTVVAVESLSEHPLARAVVRDGSDRLNQASQSLSRDGAPVQSLPPSRLNARFTEARDIRSITGQGIRASIDSEPVEVGKPTLFESLGAAVPGDLNTIVERLKRDGRTTMLVRRGSRFLGVIGLMDMPRPVAVTTIRRLRGLGVKHMMILSGDSQQVVDAIAKQVGIEEARGDLMPGDKVKMIIDLGKSGPVAMVGDGANDAPALAGATVGIAMGAAGSAVALETADVALMSDDLNKLAFAIALGRQASRIIRQNLWISLVTVVMLVPACLLGLQIGWAVVFHEGSTIVVVLNALRLLTYHEKA
jgi:Cd2+/Zn2+-exporting ATPase